MPIVKYYQKNKEHYREYNRKYLAQWRKENPDKKYKYLRPGRYNYMKHYRQDSEQQRRYKAREMVSNAISNNKLAKGECEYGVECMGRIEAHHVDYDKPLAVRWLCNKHHRQEHKKIDL